ncbi:MAG: hypothetical protein Q8R36_04845 [bacterium]|nr:hypothetical protein [bacterium]
MKYTEAQFNTLRELRELFGRYGFEIHEIVKRYRKNPLEFVAIERACDADMSPEERSAFTSAIVRLYRKTKVKVYFLEVGTSAMERAGWRELCHNIGALNGKKGCAAVVFRDEYRNNPNCPFPKRHWHQFVYQKELKKTGLAKAIQQFKNTGIVVKKGTSALT